MVLREVTHQAIRHMPYRLFSDDDVSVCAVQVRGRAVFR